MVWKVELSVQADRELGKLDPQHSPYGAASLSGRDGFAASAELDLIFVGKAAESLKNETLRYRLFA
jgi:hypothetical protein